MTATLILTAIAGAIAVGFTALMKKYKIGPWIDDYEE